MRKSKKTDVTDAPSTPGDGADEKRVINLSIDRIDVPNGRQTDERAVKELAGSFITVGLINPISVVKTKASEDGKVRYRLVSGAHRLAAAIKLKWDKISVLVVGGDADELRMKEISENVFRNSLSVLDRAVQVSEFVEIVRRKARQVDVPGGKQPNDKGIAKTAKVLGLGAKRVERYQIIAQLSEEAKRTARENNLHNNQRRLLRAAAQSDAEMQVAALKPPTKPKKQKDDDIVTVEVLEDAWKKSGISDLWDEADAEVQVTFAQTVLWQDSKFTLN